MTLGCFLPAACRSRAALGIITTVMSSATPQKIALVTGANKGIGREIAAQLASHGILVLIGARDAARGESAAQELRDGGRSAQYLEIDVTSQTAVDHAASCIEREYGRLDILVNNAAIAIDWAPPSQLDVEVLQKTWDTNVYGVFRVTKAMLPLLRTSAAGRIVNMSSGLASLTWNSAPEGRFHDLNMLLAYCSSKTAVNAISLRFAIELAGTPIKINCADPGYVATDMNQHQGPRTVGQGAATPVRLALLPDDGPTGGFFNDDGVVPW
jgi:NAD(P)-dependent dehydrogenase (short-subunit alcohol dehydrogenase family)